ncbi:hypothetical protein T11_9687 [Trichinella zimbabwensis]|uniref:NADH dehydrogenase [ubiquinone] 1 subunit C2 n=1 Tax=Trichinella zimbabwensis TaxID=268475 RepID=A0A0V1H5G1_9BILA|nr:hypothetical protein T11_9687 [Trichinella zimbabwensis]
MSDNIKVDAYGQIIPERLWYNVFSYSATEKFVLYGFVLGAGSHYLYNRIQRRPFYAGFPYALLLMTATPFSGYLIGRYRERQLRNRDRVISHYMSLHPDDFGHLTGNSRLWKEVLLPWKPYRHHENPIKWEPSKPFRTPGELTDSHSN